MNQPLAAPALAQRVITELLAAGMGDLVLAPGSRNAPLSLAAAASQLRIQVRLDERDAAFLALGMALGSDRPVGVATTSGTAVGNLLPAVMEAKHSQVPLVVVSADRPSSVLDSGANQTTRQRGLFSHFTRADAHLESGVATAPSVRHQITRLLAAARGDRTMCPGPVHLNIGLRPPLLDPTLNAKLAVPAPMPVTRARPGPAIELELGPRTVVLAGAGHARVGRAARALAAAGRLPLFAEPASNARNQDAIASYRLLVNGPLGKQIERVIVYGNPTLSRPITALLARSAVEVIVVSEHAEWDDASQRAARIASAVLLGAGEGEWYAAWQAADREKLAEFDDEQLCGRSIAAAVVASINDGANLLFGGSQLIRDADLAPVPRIEFACWANRGLAGIDGTIATAMGIALTRGRTTALIGDVTFAHDVGGLLVPTLEQEPDLRIVVGNDDGGAIFSYLEQGAPAYGEHFERVFATPHGLNLKAIARGYGWDFRRVDTIAGLRSELAAEWHGLQVIEVALKR